MRDDIFWNIIDTNFTHDDEREKLETELSYYIIECCHISLQDISDSYVEKLIEERENPVLCDMLSENYYPEQKEEVTIDFSDIFTSDELIELIRSKLDFPEYCTNWSAINDMVYSVWYPKKILIANWELLDERLPDDAIFLRRILREAVWGRFVSNEKITVEYI